jgi:hypothetical protein
MPIEIPTIDDRRYQQLVDDSLARIPNHTRNGPLSTRATPASRLSRSLPFSPSRPLSREPNPERKLA